MSAALFWILTRLFAPPAPPPLHIPLPARLIPQVEQHIGEAIKGAYLVGAFNGASIAFAVGIMLGVALGLALIAFVRLVLDLVALVRSGVRLLDALSLLLSRRARSIDSEPDVW